MSNEQCPNVQIVVIITYIKHNACILYNRYFFIISVILFAIVLVFKKFYNGTRKTPLSQKEPSHTHKNAEETSLNQKERDYTQKYGVETCLDKKERNHTQKYGVGMSYSQKEPFHTQKYAAGTSANQKEIVYTQKYGIENCLDQKERDYTQKYVPEKENFIETSSSPTKFKYYSNENPRKDFYVGPIEEGGNSCELPLTIIPAALTSRYKRDRSKDIYL